jgi:hypothetical protein
MKMSGHGPRGHFLKLSHFHLFLSLPFVFAHIDPIVGYKISQTIPRGALSLLECDVRPASG